LHKVRSKKITPFDLHVLGAPPAFVLSQDQTLYKWYLITYKVLNRCKSLRHNTLASCMNYLFGPRGSLRAPLGIVLRGFHHVQGSTSFSIVQFSRSCPPAFRPAAPPADRTAYLFYFIPPPLSRGFLKFFRGFWISPFPRRCPRGQLPYITTVFAFVNPPFLKIFDFSFSLIMKRRSSAAKRGLTRRAGGAIL